MIAEASSAAAGSRAFLHFFLPVEPAAFLASSRLALALCRRHRIAATFFLRSEDLEHREKRVAVEAILAAGQRIGSSGATGRPLDALDPASREREIIGSREEIHRILGSDCDGF